MWIKRPKAEDLMERNIEVVVVFACLFKHVKSLPFDAPDSSQSSTRMNILLDNWYQGFQCGVVRGSNCSIQSVIYSQVVRTFHTSFCASSLEEQELALDGYTVHSPPAWSRGSELPAAHCMYAFVGLLEEAVGWRGFALPSARCLHALAGPSDSTAASRHQGSAKPAARYMPALAQPFLPVTRRVSAFAAFPETAAACSASYVIPTSHHP